VVSVSARREVPVAQFFTGPRKSVLARDEIIVGVRVPGRDGVRGAFLRLGQRRAQAISKVSVAVGVVLDKGRLAWVRVALGAVAPTVVRAPRAEQVLMAGGPDALLRAREVVMEEIAPIDDLRSTRDYRRQMAGILLQRAMNKAIGR
jgi:CO/xanthine dehydrogenase FAD-binding subunit